MTDKVIHMYYLNKIKNCTLRIFEAEDDDYPNRHIVSANERAIDYWLAKANINSREYQAELLYNINWTCDDCKTRLEKLGWTVLTGKIK